MANFTGETKEMFHYAEHQHVGRALILSVHNGRTSDNKIYDAATELENATNALEILGYSVFAQVDPTKDEMEALLRQHRDEDWSNYASSVVCIMAHGSQYGNQLEVLAADDQKNSVKEMQSMLSISNCPGLKGKPKIWIVQACRPGGDVMITDSVASSTDAAPVITRNHDYLMTYAAMPGNNAIRGVFFRHFHNRIDGLGKERARQVSWMQLIASTNNAMAEEDIDSSIVQTTLRDAMVSSASLVSDLLIVFYVLLLLFL